VKKILFPTEFSEHAGDMFRYAVELAHKFDAELVFMNAYGRPEGYSLGDEEGKKERVLQILQDFAKANTPASHKDVKTRFVAELDYPADAILKVAEKEKADLIVLGMTGKTNDVNRHLGSNALKVIRASEIPVLAIPDSAKFRAIKKVVFTTDFEFEDLTVLNFLNKAFDADIKVIHIVENRNQVNKAVRHMKSLEEAYATHSNMSFEVIEGKDVENNIEKYVEGKKADLLAMTSHKRSVIGQLLAGSTTRNIAKKTKTPLLVFKND
jgi:nucleotide-binding universal stress UspA family protein